MPLTRITLRQLEAFATVADAHSFSAAGERLGLTAQAVSQLVAELEQTLEFRLFDRTTRRVSLSAAGRDYLSSAQTVLRHAQAAETAAHDVRNRAVGIVRVGAPLVLASAALPAAVHDYNRERSRVVIRIRDIPVDHLVDSVASGDVDLAIGPDRATGADVDALPLFESPWVLWCSPQHPLASRSRIRWADLKDTPLVAAGRDHELSVAQMRLTTPEDERVIPVDVVDNISTALGIAAQGSAATLAPAYVSALATAFGLEMRRVVEPETVRKVCLYRPLGRALSPAAEGFAEHVAAWLPHWPKENSLG
ncbi:MULTISPECIES: LysR family transcriptional regulator [unclassified Cupriavidus]|uniref:LysR family transcriptional regulator n=1 Tax=unclassified Cupriavidus TaxID=2640874 RepID=UPI00048DD69C|nr:MULTISPECIES: LysR family transcriptional regulator [unclassified Cupriavidus]MBP0633103.1 LysR family transcriptional regulator [Cupriavidus sp. AcVe19-1a]MBP0639384.1 LysR family transcriptional regulator [Cupriavidus sp. AcVe19-6a]